MKRKERQSEQVHRRRSGNTSTQILTLASQQNSENLQCDLRPYKNHVKAFENMATEADKVAASDTAENHANAPVEKAPDEGSKLKTLLSVLRKFLGVSDLAAVRFSLPAQLLEPTPNLGMPCSRWHIVIPRLIRLCRVLGISRSTRNIHKYWRLIGSYGTHAWNLAILVHQGSGI